MFCCVLQEVVTATFDLEDVRSYRGEACQPHLVSPSILSSHLPTLVWLCCSVDIDTGKRCLNWMNCHQSQTFWLTPPDCPCL